MFCWQLVAFIMHTKHIGAAKNNSNDGKDLAGALYPLFLKLEAGLDNVRDYGVVIYTEG